MKKKIIIASLCSVNILLQILIRFSDGFVNGYKNSIYPIWLGTLGRITSVINVSVVEIVLYIFVLSSLIYVIYGFVKSERRKHAINILYKVAILANVLFLMYTFTCGIHYHAASFAEKNNMILKDYTLEELESVGRILTEELNESAKKISRDENGIMQISDNIHDRAKQEMIKLESQYEGLSGYTTTPKPILVSEILSYMQVSGIYSPFTIEANYNADIVPYNIPFTICHELAHTKGFMQEEEANFIAFLACEQSNDDEFRYSGMLLGWTYVTNAIAREDRELYEELREILHPEIRKDLQANSDFWNRYDGKLGEISENINDAYLKSNSQEDGIKSYGRVVDYIVNYYTLP